MIISEAISEFITYQRVCGNSPATVDFYSIVLRLFREFTGDVDVDELTLQLCNEYSISLSDVGISSVTKQSYIRGLRAFLNWLYDNEYIDIDLCARFKLPRAQRTQPDVLTDDEIRRLFFSFSGNDWRTSRNRLMVALMIDSGLRRHEVVSLELGRIHVSERYLFVTGKGNKDRYVPLADFTISCLKDYLHKTRFATPRKFLFIQESPDGIGFVPITDNTVKQLFYKLKERTGIERLHPHLLRHTFATRYYMNGGNVYTLQSILGHTSLEMTKRYVSLAHSMMMADFAKFSPLNNLKNKNTGHQGF